MSTPAELPQRRRGRAFARILALILALPLLSLGLTQTDWGRARLRALVIDVLRSELGLEARLGEVRVDLSWPPGLAVVVTDITLDDPAYGPLATAHALHLRPSLGPLLLGRLDLEHVTLDRPTLTLLVRDGEVRNFPRLPAREGGSDELPLRRFEMRQARVTVDTDLGVHATLAPIDLDLTVTGGTDVALQLDVRGGVVQHAGGEEPISRLVLNATLHAGRRLSIAQAVLRSPSVRLEVHDAEVPLPYRGDFAGHVRGRLLLAELARLPEALGLPALEGIAEVDLALSRNASVLRGQGQVQLRRAVIAERYSLGELTELHIELDGESLRLREDSFMQVARRGGRVGLSGRIGLSLPFFSSLTLTLDDVSLPRLLSQLGVTDDAIVSWFLAGRIELRGTLAPLSLRGTIVTRTRDFLLTQDAYHARPRHRVVGVAQGRLAGDVHLTDEFLRFEQLHLDTGRTRADVDVHIGFGNYFRVHARVGRIDLADVTPLVDFALAGVGSAEVLVVGPYDDAELTGRLDMRAFSFDGMSLGDVVGDFRMEKEGLALRFLDLSAQKRDTRYRVRDLLLDFSHDRFEAIGDVRFDRLTLADAYHTFGLDQDERFETFQGVGSGELGVRYSLGFPGDGPTGTLALDMGFDFARADLAGFAFDGGRFEGQFRWLDYARGIDGGELELSHLSLRKGDATVTVGGRMGLDGALQMTFAADRLDVRETEGLGESLPSLSGHYGLLGTLSGTLDVPRLHADLLLANLGWDGQPVGGGRAYIRLTDRSDEWVQEAAAWSPDAPPAAPCAYARMGLAQGRWAPDPPVRTPNGPVPARAVPMAFLVCGEGLDGQVRVDMALGWTSVYPLRGRVELRGLSLLPFAPEDEAGEPTLEGRVSGRITLVGGDLLTDGSLSGDVIVEELAVSAGGVALENRGDLRLRMDAGTLEVVEAALAGDGTRLAVTGRGSPHALDYTVRGSVDLALLSTLTPMVTQVDGSVRLRVNVRGPADDPAVFGRAAVRADTVVVRDLPMPVRDLRGEVQFTARRMIFEGFRARLGTGSVSLEGAATLEGGAVGAYHADLRVDDLALTPEEGLDVQLDAQGRLEWNTQMRLPLLRGQVSLDRLRYTRPISLSPTIGELYRPERMQVERYDPGAETLAFDLRVVQRSPARVRNNLVDLDVAIEDSERPFRIVGTDQRYGVLGSLRIPRGIVRFRSSELEVRRGTIELDDPDRINPVFDVTAFTEIRRRQDVGAPNWRLRLRAHGNIDGFQLDASSTPELTQQDIMLLLTIGMTTIEAQQLQAQDLGGTAIEALSAITGVQDEVSGALGVIDDIAITTMYHPVTNRPEPQVTVGSRISDRIRLTASTGLSTETRSVQATAEWRLNQQTRIQAAYDNINRESASSFGNIGVDLRWRLEFE